MEPPFVSSYQTGLRYCPTATLDRQIHFHLTEEPVHIQDSVEDARPRVRVLLPYAIILASPGRSDVRSNQQDAHLRQDIGETLPQDAHQQHASFLSAAPVRQVGLCVLSDSHEMAGRADLEFCRHQTYPDGWLAPVSKPDRPSPGRIPFSLTQPLLPGARIGLTRMRLYASLVCGRASEWHARCRTSSNEQRKGLAHPLCQNGQE